MTIQPSAIWRVRPSGNNANGGGYDGTTYPGGTDYSQQDAAQASWTVLSCTGSASTTLTDAGATGLFTAAMVGNAIEISGGTGFTAGFYFVASFTDANNVVLDRSPASSTSAASGASGALGGGWADFWTHCQSSGPLVPGNTVYILGSGTATYSAPDYAPPTYYQLAGGTQGGAKMRYLQDPQTPTGYYPLIQTAGLFIDKANNCFMEGLQFFAASASNARMVEMNSASYSDETVWSNCVFDQNGYDISCLGLNAGDGAGTTVIGCEIFSSVAARGTNNSPGLWTSISSSYTGMRLIGNNIHNCIGNGVAIAGSNYGGAPVIIGNIISNCGKAGIITGDFNAENANPHGMITGNTIDGNKGGGIVFQSSTDLCYLSVVQNNIISNHTASGTYGLSVATGTASSNDQTKLIVDYNTYYNNTQDLAGISYGPHDTSSNSSSGAPNINTNDPYVDQATGNYTLTTTYIGTGYPQQPFPSH